LFQGRSNTDVVKKKKRNLRGRGDHSIWEILHKGRGEGKGAKSRGFPKPLSPILGVVDPSEKKKMEKEQGRKSEARPAKVGANHTGKIALVGFS